MSEFNDFQIKELSPATTIKQYGAKPLNGGASSDTPDTRLADNFCLGKGHLIQTFVIPVNSSKVVKTNEIPVGRYVIECRGGIGYLYEDEITDLTTIPHFEFQDGERAVIPGDGNPMVFTLYNPAGAAATITMTFKYMAFCG